MTRDRIGVRRSLGLLLAGAVLASACTDDGAGQAGDTTTTVEATTTTESEPATTTTAAVPFDIEVRRAAIELLEIRNDVFMHPDPTRVGEYISSFCTCLERERGIVERLQNQGHRWQQPAVEPLGVRLVDPDATEPVLVLVGAQPSGGIADSSGTRVESIGAVDLTPYSLTLVRESNSWLINSLEGLTLDRPVADAIVGEGLP